MSRIFTAFAVIFALGSAQSVIINETAETFPILESPNGGPSAGLIGWMQRSADPTYKNYTDITGQYDNAYNQIMKNGAGVLSSVGAQNYVYLIVPGLLGKHYPFYMNTNRDALQNLGLAVRKSNIDTDAAVLKNAATIRSDVLSIAAGGKQVIIVAHSKGCVDTAAALDIYPEIQSKVRGVIAIQGPYGGSPIAQDLSASSPVRFIVSKIVQTIFGGDPQSIGDLTYDVRQSFLRTHRFPSNVPLIGVRSRSTRISSLMFASAKYIQDSYGADNDGLVAASDATIPGARMVYLDNMDHGDTVFEMFKFCKYRPTQMTQALVWLLLSK